MRYIILFYTHKADSVYASRFLGFSVYVSNSTNKKDGVLCYHDTNYTVSTITSRIAIECISQGRYVIFYNTREGNLSLKIGYSDKVEISLCEVEVYGSIYYLYIFFLYYPSSLWLKRYILLLFLSFAKTKQNFKKIRTVSHVINI